MRILVVSNLFPPAAVGGYEMCCSEVAERLAERHEVLVLTSIRGGDGARGRVPVRRELPLLPATPRGSLRAPAAAITAARLTRRLLAEFRPELIFVWNGAGIPHVTLRVFELSGAPVAYSVAEHWFGQMYRNDQFLRHLFPGDRGMRRPWALLMRGVNLHPALKIELQQPVPAAVVWNSNALRGMTPMPETLEPILERTIYPATSRHALYAELERQPARLPTVLFIGRLERVKGPDVAYRALADLRVRHGLAARLLMVGSSKAPERRELAALAAQLGITPDVELTGQLGSSELAARLSEAHALVVPSRWEEPFGLVCIEAALARVPVVAARSGGIPEALHEDEHALFFEKEDHAACADALAATLTGGAATEARVRRAYEHACHFSSARHLEEMEGFAEAAVTELSNIRRARAATES
ncbi:MAG: glycosyltransferase family 4 protein [Solirubrobacteraceae bacterium]